ncbi:MAG: hypothetical protein IJU51_07225, partial [Clostridia bacterium]|nr:hypothetical protein [Clostridia bacterium]
MKQVKAISIIGMMSELQKVVKFCGDSQMFHPDDTMKFYSDTQNFLPLQNKNTYSEYIKQLEDSAELLGFRLEYKKLEDLNAGESAVVKYVSYFVSKTEGLANRNLRLQQDIESCKRNIEKVSHFVGSNINFTEIMQCEFITPNFGRMPTESYEKLSQYAENPYVLFFPYTSDSTHYWGAYFTPPEQKEEVDRIFSSLYFEKLDIPMLVVTADDTAAESFASDLRSMLNEEVSVLGMKEFVFRHVEAVSRTGEQERISALHAFSGGKVRIMTASVTGLIQRTIPREKLMTSAFELEADSRITPAQLEQALIRCGYTRTEQVEGPGQYSIRGGILDFFTPTMPDPVRMEFWGDEIDTMASFRVSDQRRCGSIERAVVLPAAETLVSLYAGGRDTLADGLESFAASYEKRRKSELARQVAAMLRTDAERIRGNVELHDADKYMPLIYDMGSGLDYIPEDAFIFFDRPNTCTERARDYIKQLTEDIQELNRNGIMAMSADSYYVSVDSLLAGLAAFPVYMSDAFTVSRSPLLPRTLASLSAKQLPSYAGNARAAADDVRSYMKQGFGTAVLAGDERRAEVLTDFLNNNSVKARRGTDDEVPAPGECIVLTGALTSGMEYPGLKLVILTDSQIIRKKDRSRAERRLGADRQRIESYADLSAGDYVVHESHGIGRFAGIVRMKVDGYEKDYVKINYAGTDCLYVPVTQLDTVTKYTGVGEDKVVKLSKMDGVDWMKKRSRAKGAAKEMAKKLIALYAARQKVSGFAFSPDTEWQKEF